MKQLLCRDKEGNKIGTQNHGKAEKDLVLIGGTFRIFCPLKRYEVGKELGFNL